jgi:hypothetical protein
VVAERDQTAFGRAGERSTAESVAQRDAKRSRRGPGRACGRRTRPDSFRSRRRALNGRVGRPARRETISSRPRTACGRLARPDSFRSRRGALNGRVGRPAGRDYSLGVFIWCIVRRLWMTPSRPRSGRLLILAAGLALFFVTLLWVNGQHHGGQRAIYAMAAAFTVVLLGVFAVGPWITALVAGVLGRFGRTPHALGVSPARGQPERGVPGHRWLDAGRVPHHGVQRHRRQRARGPGPHGYQPVPSSSAWRRRPCPRRGRRHNGQHPTDPHDRAHERRRPGDRPG